MYPPPSPPWPPLCRYHAVLFPITTYICEILEENNRDTNLMDLSYEDLEKLHGDEVARICEWLTEKVDGFSSKVKPEAKDVEEEVHLVLAHCSEACKVRLMTRSTSELI